MVEEKFTSLEEYIEKIDNLLDRLNKCTSYCAVSMAVSKVEKLNIEKFGEDIKEKYRKCLELLSEHILYEETELAKLSMYAEIDNRKKKELEEIINKQKKMVNYFG